MKLEEQDIIGTIEKWYVKTAFPEDLYKAPEQQTCHLCGFIYGAAQYKDGNYIQTSALVGWDPEHQAVVTKSGHGYKFGEVAKEYEALFPLAEQRWITNLSVQGDGNGFEEEEES